MGSDSRTFLGPVQGGHRTRYIPSNSLDYNIAVAHTRGRTQAMAETLLHIAYVKSANMVSSTARLSSTGAQFQDFKGGSGFVMAHRAIMAVNLGGKNIAEMAQGPSQTRLRDMLIVPQARTDPMTVVANYCDRLLEIRVLRPER